jgi:hypothetical protein
MRVVTRVFSFAALVAFLTLASAACTPQGGSNLSPYDSQIESPSNQPTEGDALDPILGTGTRAPNPQFYDLFTESEFFTSAHQSPSPNYVLRGIVDCITSDGRLFAVATLDKTSRSTQTILYDYLNVTLVPGPQDTHTLEPSRNGTPASLVSYGWVNFEANPTDIVGSAKRFGPSESWSNDQYQLLYELNCDQFNMRGYARIRTTPEQELPVQCFARAPQSRFCDSGAIEGSNLYNESGGEVFSTLRAGQSSNSPLSQGAVTTPPATTGPEQPTRAERVRRAN